MQEFDATFKVNLKLSNTLIISLLLLSGAVTAHAERSVVAPDWTLETANGSPVNLHSAVQQRATILFFWATWCPYCKALMPHLQSIKLEHQDSVQVLAINIFDDGDPIAFMAQAGYDFTLLLSGDAVADEYGIAGTPGVIILDRNRILQFDLRSLPDIDLPDTGEAASHHRKAAFRAPYWAAEIRKSLDDLLHDSYPIRAPSNSDQAGPTIDQESKDEHDKTR